ncbi:MAG TPA: transporter associated domain-containing protein [Phycisphaerales bacterium]|nr:transporter associated domain-containing protein [Phycisphaerales bacterium]
MLDVKRYLLACDRSGTTAVSSHLRPARFVPENARLDRLLERFREAETSVAVCVDEHGGVSGLISIEDVVEELVSHQPDAESEPESEVRSLGNGRWLVPGRLGVREWAELLGVETALLGAHPRVATVAGLLIARLGRIPAVGDEVSIGNVRLRAESARDRVVDTVLVTLEGGAA